MASIRRKVGSDGTLPDVELASVRLAGERHTPEDGGGATLKIGQYVIELDRTELALVSMLSIQRPSHVEVTFEAPTYEPVDEKEGDS